MEKVKFVGLDVHKLTIQISLLSDDGKELSNYSIANKHGDIKYHLGKIPKDAQLVMESSSVWKAPFFQIRDELDLDVILSNPYVNKMIATSKKKTDKVDARILAEMHRGGFITGSHIPSKFAMECRDITRYRHQLVKHRTGLKNSIHGILLQKSIRFKGTPFSGPWVDKVRLINDHRIDSYLRVIDTLNDQILRADIRIREAVKKSPDAQLLQSIPGVGAYIALVVASGIDDIDRFPNAGKMTAYFGTVPSVRSSGNTIKHGHITKTGDVLVRTMLVEAIYSHVRYTPKSEISLFYKKIAAKKSKSIAAVAAVAKLLRKIFWMLKERKSFSTLQSGKYSGVNTLGKTRACNSSQA